MQTYPPTHDAQTVELIKTHKPREVIRIERDYSAGEIVQFWTGYPAELEGRVSIIELVCDAVIV